MKLKLQAIYSIAKYKGSYNPVSYGAKPFKLLHDAFQKKDLNSILIKTLYLYQL